jgi:hypothetical protein
MLPRLRRGGDDQRRMKRGLAAVQVALRQDADHVVGVQVNRVGIRRRAITAAPAHDLHGQALALAVAALDSAVRFTLLAASGMIGN